MIRLKIFTKIHISLLLILTTISCQSQNAQDRSVTVFLRGVSVANIAITPLTGANAHKPIKVYEQVKNGQNVVFTIDKRMVPADFQLHIEYLDIKSGQPTNAEQRIFVNKQNVSLSINPVYATIADSVIFPDNDNENRTYQQFNVQNQLLKENIGLIQLVLTKYDDKQSVFFKEGIKEYKHKRQQHSDWLKQQISRYKNLFVSHVFILQEIPETDFLLEEKVRKNKTIDNYINIIDFKDTLLTRTYDYRKWLDNYVNMHFDRHYTASQTDSALTTAGEKIIEKAKAGHPLVYGKMLDYFFEGYESMGLESGIKMLAKYANDPKCPGTKKSAIIKRIEGLNHIKIGVISPNFEITDIEKNVISFHDFGKTKPYKLLMIWSADCEHCQEVTKQLYPFYINSPMGSKFDVLAISIDETETEIPIWESKVKELTKWTHANSKGGLLSEVARLYYVVSTPLMIIVDTKTNEILSIPETARDIAMFFNNK